MRRERPKKRNAAAARNASNGVDAGTVRRRRREVNRLRADGYTQREIADMLLDMHMNGGTPLFTFMDRNRVPLDESELTLDEKRDRAFATVRDDVTLHRREAQAEQPDAERLADDRYLLSERFRLLYKRTIQRMESEPDNGKWVALVRTAIDLAARMARLQGIETEKPIELRLPERYRVWIADDGIIHRGKCDDDETLN
jgi:hypothetical protein